MQLQPIHIYDSAWSSTFRHLVAPQSDEWFPGLLLRCDEVNHWESGATMAHLIRSVKEYRSTRSRSNWVVVPLLVLELLSQLLALPTSSLLATTYQLELASLYDTPSPHATYLCRSFPFHLCPDCIVEGRLLKRTLILPHITCCPSHQVVLVGTCRCGMLLQLFPRQSLPFTCQKCCLDWTELPRITSKPERIALEQKLMSYYTFFFDNAKPTIIAKAQQLVRKSMKGKKVDRLKSFDGNYRYVELYDAKRISLGSLVELLVSLDLSLHDIVDYEGPLPWWSVKNRVNQRSARDNKNELVSEEDL
jgi:TniQ